MNDINVVAKREASSYRVSVDIDNRVFTIKFDTGATDTVISVRVFSNSLTDSDLEKFTKYCEEHSRHNKEFISATGDSFKGYLVTAHNVRLGKSVLPNFRYYLVIESKRDIALLGYDFIDKCQCSHDPGKNFYLTGFDVDNYGKDAGTMENDEVIAFIDSLSD